MPPAQNHSDPASSADDHGHALHSAVALLGSQLADKGPACDREIKERKHQADLAKLEDKREGEQIQLSNRLYQLEIQKEKKKRKKKLNTGGSTMVIQVHKDKALEQLTAQINEAFKVEDDCLARVAAAVEDEYQIKKQEKEAKQKAAIEAIAEHRATVMKMKVEKEKEEKAESERDRNQQNTADCIYLEQEKEKKQRQRDASMEVQKFQIQQMAEKRAKTQQEKQDDLDYDAQRKAAFCKDQAFWR
ncbi:uncharacterized protein AAGF69_005421 [Amazona ochrocephala]